MVIKFTPIQLTEDQINDVIVMSLTGEQSEMIEYDDTKHMIVDNLGKVGYACAQGFVGIGELGHISVYETLDELLEKWGNL